MKSSIISELAQKYGMHKSEVDQIVQAMFCGVRQELETENPSSVRLMYLGLFKPKNTVCVDSGVFKRRCSCDKCIELRTKRNT